MPISIDGPNSGEASLSAPAAAVSKDSMARKRGRPFAKGVSGNPKGRPPGSRNRSTLLVQAILEHGAEALGKKAVELALEGDKAMLQFCLSRVVPPCRDAAITVDLPALNSPARCREAAGKIIRSAANGEMTPSAAAIMIELIDAQRLSFDYTGVELHLEQRDADRHLKRLLLAYPPGAPPPEDEKRWEGFYEDLLALDLPAEQEERLAAEGMSKLLSDASFERLFGDHDD
jgi:hypothetical protein